MQKLQFRYAIFLVFLTAAVGMVVKVATSQSVPSPVSLQVLASESGAYVRYLSPETYPRYDLTQLVAQSTDIITATAGTNVCHVSADGTLITTDFQITVQTVQKGRLPVGNTLTVSVPGGKVAFKTSDGRSVTAEIRTPWMKRMTSGNNYMLFLRPADANATPAGTITSSGLPRYALAGGPEGLFEITASNLVMSNSGRLHDPMWQYNNVSLANFKLLVSEPGINVNPGVPQP